MRLMSALSGALPRELPVVGELGTARRTVGSAVVRRTKRNQ
jgi:hypothetical protein